MPAHALQKQLRALRTLQAPEQVDFDPREGRWVPGSGAFKPQSDGTISVDLEELLVADGKPLTHGYPRVARGVGLVAHTLERLETDGFTTTHAPIPGNEYHAEARGKPSGSVRRKLAEECEIIVPIDGDEARRHKDEQLARMALKGKP